MNDFLHSLRTGNYQRYRKPYSSNGQTNGNYNGRDNGNQKRNEANHKSEALTQATTFLKEIEPLINDFLKGNTIFQETLSESFERRAIAEERKANAMETIAVALARIAGIEIQTQQNSEKDSGKTSKTTKEDKPGEECETSASTIKDKAVYTIKKLRDNGLSYEQIARQLEEEKIPTLSGRGKWHAPTVSNLLKNVA